MTVYDFVAPSIAGTPKSLADFRGQVLLIVNVASQCGFTPQYIELEALYREYHDAGFTVLGFPCNQFGGQEPGTESTIAEFCRTDYDITFPLFARTQVDGPLMHPLFGYLTATRPGIFGIRHIKWNFTKFLIARNGVPYRRYRPSLAPSRLRSDISRLLAEGA